MGDFNVDFIKNSKNKILNYFENIGLKSKLGVYPTTKEFTAIDNVFSNIESIDVGTIDAFFSHHKQLYLRIMLKTLHQN